MTRQELKALLSDPARIDPGQLRDLIALSEQYPYCGAFHRLILICLHRSSDLRYAAELQKRILSIPDPEELFLVLRDTASDETQTTHTDAWEYCPKEDGDTFSIIEDFLEDHPEDTTEIEGLLDMSGSATEETAVKEKSETASEIVEAFLSAGPEAEIIRHGDEKPETKGEEKREPDMESEYLTETLARIYIRQEKYESALRIFRSLNLKYPKKSGYFAEQIAYLEKVIKTLEAVRLS